MSSDGLRKVEGLNVEGKMIKVSEGLHRYASPPNNENVNL